MDANEIRECQATAERRKTKLGALPLPLRQLVGDLEVMSRASYEQHCKHADEHDHCCYFPGVHLPESQGGALREYCPVHDILMGSWGPLWRMLASLEWLLLDAPIPHGYEEEFAAPCDYCEERPGILGNPDPKKDVGKVCQSCHDQLDRDREERECIAEAERRDEEPYNRADHERDMAKDRAVTGER